MPSEWTIDTLRVYFEQRFTLADRALDLQTAELARRLEGLNHAHRMAREKEAMFVSRETFDTFITRTAMDFEVLRREIQTTSSLVATTRENSASALATALREQTEANETRFGRIETLLAANTGRQAGIGVVWAVMLGAATIISSCVAIAALIFNFVKL